MNKTTIKDNKVLYLFSRNVLGDIPRIEIKEIPSEILYGVMELKANGWIVNISDDRHKGLFGKINYLIKPYGVNFINYSTMMKIKSHDVIIVKGDFSLMTTLFCRLLGKKIIYKDAMFEPPKRFWKRWSAYINLRLASAVVAYSKYQARFWEKRFGLKEDTIRTMHYCVDTSFYPEFKYEPTGKTHAISVGRDPGRDYESLAGASKLNGLNVKLITLPYLLSDNVIRNENIDILQNVSYTNLFELYKNSVISVVPLSKGLNYPTGIRGVLESLAIGMPTIATRTPVLEEYFQDGKDILFVEAEDEHALSSAMTELVSNKELASIVAANGQEKVRSCYNMSTYIKEFEDILIETVNA